MMGAPAFVHGDRMGSRGHDLAEMHGEGMGPEGRGYGMPGEPDGMYGRGMMPG